MRTHSSDPFDFDASTPPPLGTLRDVARRHRCTVQEARRIMGVEDLVELVPLAELEVGDVFRFNFMTWRKERRTMNHRTHGTMIECEWKHGRAFIAEAKMVEPVDEMDVIGRKK